MNPARRIPRPMQPTSAAPLRKGLNPHYNHASHCAESGRHAMPTYQVTAFYERPELERNAVVTAESPERAIVRALMEHRIPAGFTRDEYGWIQPVLWTPELAGASRWPRIVGRDRLAWGDSDAQKTLRFSVEERRR